MTTDRRVRLRPKNGARQLYYGTAGVVNSHGQNLFDELVPWLPSGIANSIAPNIPNILGNITNLGSLAGNLISGIGSTVTGFFMGNTGNADRSFGNGQGGNFLGDNVNILAPLAETDGFVFPITPNISYAQGALYSSYDLAHTNQELLAYNRTSAPEIVVNGNFAVNNANDAAYALACVHFLRTVIKMDFGQSSSTAGTPPPVLLFSAYGQYQFNDLPVILRNFNVDYPQDATYVQIPNTETYIPTIFSVQLNLVVQNSPAKLRQFNLNRFRNGQQLKSGGWI